MRFLASVILLGSIFQAWAAEPIAGDWSLKSQQVSGQEVASRPLMLRVTQSGDMLAFEYAVAGNQKQEVSLRFTARLDGSEGEVKDSTGRKMGTAKITRSGPSQYLLMLQGPNRPTSSGKMTVGQNGKTLVSESDATAAGGAKTHTVQVFERQ